MGEWRVGIFANRTINPGEEITYDYKFESFGQMQKCGCNATNCRGYIGMKKNGQPLETLKKVKKSAPPTNRAVKAETKIASSNISTESILEKGSKRESAKKALKNAKRLSMSSEFAAIRKMSFKKTTKSKSRASFGIKKRLELRGLPFLDRNLVAVKSAKVVREPKEFEEIVKEMHMQSALDCDQLLLTKKGSFPLFTNNSEAENLAERILSGELLINSRILKRNLRQGGRLANFPAASTFSSTRKTVDELFGCNDLEQDYLQNPVVQVMGTKSEDGSNRKRSILASLQDSNLESIRESKIECTLKDSKALETDSFNEQPAKKVKSA